MVIGNPTGPTGYAEARGGTDTTAALITAITGTPAHHDVELERTVLHVPYRWRDPVLAPQMGGPIQVSPDGFYPLQGVLAAGSLWYPMQEPCVPAGDTTTRDCVHLVQVDVSGPQPRFVEEVEIGLLGEYLVTPAVAVDRRGRAVVVATETGPDMFASIVAIPIGVDGTVGAPTTLRPGMSYTYADYCAPGLTRWGDESATAVDPLDPDRLWLAGEFAFDRADWGTAISAVTITDRRCADAASCRPGTYRPVPATPVLDTRTGLGAERRPLAAHATTRVQVTGRAGIPTTGVSAVALTLTASDARRYGHLTVYPAGSARPGTADLSFSVRDPGTNEVFERIGADGSIDVHNSSGGSVQLHAEVDGYYLGGRAIAAGAYRAVDPTRILNARTGSRPLAAQSTIRLTVTGRAGVPTRHVAAVVLDVTARARRAGHLTAYQSGTGAPATTDLSYRPGHSITNLVIVPVGAGGRIELRNRSGASVGLTADIAGYFLAGRPAPGGSYRATTQRRLLTARTAPGRTQRLRVAGTGGLPPADATTVVLSVTAAHASRTGQLALAQDGARGTVATVVDYEPSRAVTNLVIVPVGRGGTVTMRNDSPGSVSVSIELVGSYTGH